MVQKVFSILKRGFQLVLIPIAVSAAVLVMLSVSYLIPTEKIREHAASSVHIFEQEGLYYRVTGAEGSSQDNFVDSLYMNQALVGTEDDDLIHLVLCGYSYMANAEDEPIENLKAAATDPESVTLVKTERRFFNGHVAVLKPLLWFMTYTGIRQFNLYTCLLLTCLFGYLMYRRGLGKYVLPMMLSILFMRPLAIWLNMTFTGIYLCTILPCILMLLIKKETLKQKAWLIFGITGSVTFCFNMNYFQLISFGLPLLLYVMITGCPEKPPELIRIAADFFIAWMIGYAGAMLIKWALYAVIVDGAIFKDVTNRVTERTGLYEVTRFGTVMKNTRIAFASPWWDLMEAGFVIYTAVQWIRNRERITFSVTEILLLVIALLIPVARFMIFANHSDLHGGFTYRILMIPILAVNVMITKKRTFRGLK